MGRMSCMLENKVESGFVTVSTHTLLNALILQSLCREELVQHYQLLIIIHKNQEHLRVNLLSDVNR